MNKEVEARIEYEETIGEANPGSYQPIRFSRIKYKRSPEAHIDIRRYQRGYEDDEEVFFPTKTGFRFLEREFRRVVREYTLVPQTYLHPRISRKCEPLLDAHEYESAVLQAFKLVEVKIRDKIGALPEEHGVRLIRKAFHPETGPLTDASLPKAEREAFANYIAGAYGYYKNPCSHRDVGMDFLSAFVRIVVASDLLTTVENAKLSSA